MEPSEAAPEENPEKQPEVTTEEEGEKYSGGPIPKDSPPEQTKD